MLWNIALHGTRSQLRAPWAPRQHRHPRPGSLPPASHRQLPPDPVAPGQVGGRDRRGGLQSWWHRWSQV